MPVQVSHPGVYIEEIPSSSKTVGGVSTSTGAFVDFFSRGPMSDASNANAVQVFSYREVERTFGGLHTKSEASYALMQFFNNGGQTAFVVRCDDGTGLGASRKVTVNIPYLINFAKDARDAARAATTAAHAAQKVVRASLAIAAVKGVKVPALAPAAKAEAAAAALDDLAYDTYKALAAARGQIRLAVEAAKDAIDNAKNASADVDVTAASSAYTVAAARLDAIDLRLKDKDAIEKVVQSARDAAKDAATQAAAVAKEHDKYLEGTAEGIAAAVSTANDAVDALTEIYLLTGLGADTASTRLADFLKARGDDEPAYPADIVQRLDTVLTASGFALDLAKQNAQTQPDEARCTAVETAIREAELKRDAIEPAPEDQRDAVCKDAVDAAKTAADAAQQAVDALGDAVADAKKAAEPVKKSLEEARTEDGAVAKAVEALEGLGEEPKTEDLTAAIQAAMGALDKSLEVKDSALGLVPEEVKVEDDWPDVAKAAEVAADQTLVAAEKTREAADAAEAAGKVLAERVLEFEAAEGGIADSTRKAAKAAADKATAAKIAADKAAGEAELAANQVRIGPSPEAKEVLADGDAIEEARQTIIDAGEAAEGAAKAAGEAADTALDAHIAAMAAGEAGAPPNLQILAASPGVWGNSLKCVVLNATQYQFNLEVREYRNRQGKAVVVNSEKYTGLTLQDEDAKNFAIKVVNSQSVLVRLSYKGPAVKGASPNGDGTVFDSLVAAMFQPMKGGRDGNPPRAEHLIPALRTALDNIAPNVFNLLCAPVIANYPASEASVAVTEAMNYCEQKRAFMIVDIPRTVRTVDDMKKWMGRYGNAVNYCGATYYPRLTVPDPLNDYRPRNVGPSGTMAGIYARTDQQRGIWKAPAGVAAVLQGADIVAKLTDAENGQLNPLGVNVLRSFPVYGNICWGARTLAGADQIQSEWKYINVRRLVSYIEESLFQALKWAVFEPNDENLWHRIRLQVGSFLAGLFASGAFQGTSPGDAYFVNCDSTTTTQIDIDQGIVNIVVGIAPVKPAEFVILRIQQIAGQE